MNRFEAGERVRRVGGVESYKLLAERGEFARIESRRSGPFVPPPFWVPTEDLERDDD